MTTKQVSLCRTVHGGAAQHDARDSSRIQIPLRDLSECLLAAYEGVSQRAYRLFQARGAEPGSEMNDWKNAERDLLGAMPVDLAESEENYYALASVPGYSAGEISVAVEDCWLLISGYGHCFEQEEQSASEIDFNEDCAANLCREGRTADRSTKRGCQPWDSRRSMGADESFEDGVVRRPFCVVELGRKVDAARSIAVLANGLVAVRMAKAVLGATMDGDQARM